MVTPATNLLRVDWLEPKFTHPGRIGLTLLPGRADRDRIMAEDLEVLKTFRITHMVPLITDRELTFYGVHNLLSEYASKGFKVIRLPILDGGIPNIEEMRTLVVRFSEICASGGRLVVHCVGGLGRSGTVAACFLKAKGMGTREAIAEVRRVRSPQAIENKIQETFIEAFPL